MTQLKATGVRTLDEAVNRLAGAHLRTPSIAGLDEYAAPRLDDVDGDRVVAQLPEQRAPRTTRTKDPTRLHKTGFVTTSGWFHAKVGTRPRMIEDRETVDQSIGGTASRGHLLDANSSLTPRVRTS